MVKFQVFTTFDRSLATSAEFPASHRGWKISETTQNGDVQGPTVNLPGVH